MVTVRPFLNFLGPWTDPEKDDFRTRFIDQVRRTWSARYQFQCTKLHFTDLVVTPIVRCEFAPDVAHAHFDVAVDHTSMQKGMTAVNRESYSDPNVISSARFHQSDAPKRPHDNPTTRCSLAKHEVDRIGLFLTGNNVADIPFDADDEIDAAARPRLQAFIAAMRRTALPSAARVPLIVTGYGTSRLSSSAARKRAAKVAEALSPLADRNPVKMRTVEKAVEARKAAIKKGFEGYKKFRKEGRIERGEPFLQPESEQHPAAEREIEDIKAAHADRRVTIEADTEWAEAYRDSDPYSILAHEFGHMLGNPDEYFGWGPAAVDQPGKRSPSCCRPATRRTRTRRTGSRRGSGSRTSR